MTKSNSQPALQEIKHNIARQDFIKARLIMDHFPELGREEQKAILLELSEAEEKFAIPVLSYLLVKHQKFADEFPAIPETIVAKAMHSPDVVVAGLTGEDPERIYYMKLVGELNLQQAVPDLINLMRRLEDKEALLVAFSSLGVLGNPEAINGVSEFLYVDDDFELVAAAISTLGTIATPTAIHRLAEILGKDTKTDRLILDVFAELQDDVSLHKLNEALKSTSAPVRNHARSWLVAVGDKAVPILITNLSGNDPDQQILSLNILQEIGDKSAALAIRKLINSHPANANIRFAAYEALAELSLLKGDYVLAGGLTDTDSNVRLAAAKAIDRNLNSTLVSGIMNMVAGNSDETANIIRAVIDAQAGNLFLGLLDSELFKKKATDYLGCEVHQDIREFFVSLLLKEKQSALANTITNTAQKLKKQTKGRVCAVDDSNMILNIYRSTITELGYEPFLFADPVEALSWLENEKPDILCTDLNMPGMTGLEVIQKVRAKYNKNDLPIILVTTQNEVRDNKAAWEAGVSDIMHKPFDAAVMTEVFEKVAG